ncbi:MAG: ABC transporter substrate-binding protein [Oligoflexia bacterium]|nr:ABC transporter substrate-binding protein [Oligoflexia bacterium]
MRRLLLGSYVAIILAFQWPFPGKADPQTLGIILPLSGKAANAGIAVRNGATLANESLQQPFKLIFEDNELDNAKTVTAARKLISTDKVSGLIVYASGPSNAAAPIAEQAKVPMIGLSVDPNVSRGRNWVMIHWASNEAVAKQLVSELVRRNLKTVAILTTQVQGNLDLEEVFLRTAKAAGLAIVFQTQILPTEMEFGSVLLQLQRKAPAAVFINLYYGQAGAFVLQSATRHFSPQFCGHYVLDNEAEIASAHGALEGAFFASTGAGDLSFDRDYQQRFGARPILGAIGAFDVVGLMSAAAQNAPDSERFNRNLHQTRNFRGRIGRYDALDDNTFDVPAGLGVVQNGSIVRVPSGK